MACTDDERRRLAPKNLRWRRSRPPLPGAFPTPEPAKLKIAGGAEARSRLQLVHRRRGYDVAGPGFADLRAVLRPARETLQPLFGSAVLLHPVLTRRGVRHAGRRHPPARRPSRADRRGRHGQDDLVPRGVAVAGSEDIRGVRPGSVSLARRSAEDAARGLRRRVGGRNPERPVARRQPDGSQLPALRLPRLASTAQSVRRRHDRRGAEPDRRAARRDPHSVRPRQRPEAARSGARWTARAAGAHGHVGDAAAQPARDRSAASWPRWFATTWRATSHTGWPSRAATGESSSRTRPSRWCGRRRTESRGSSISSATARSCARPARGKRAWRPSTFGGPSTT